MAQQRQMALPAYLVGFLLAFVPIFQTLTGLVPFRTADARWRFGAFGLVISGMTIPVAGLLICLLVAATFEHRRTQRLIGIVSLIMAVVLLVLLGMFVLDTLQVKSGVKETAKTVFEVATLSGAFYAFLSIVTLSAFCYAAFRGPKPVRAAKEQRGAGMIIGTTTQPARVGALPKPDAAVRAAPDKAT